MYKRTQIFIYGLVLSLGLTVTVSVKAASSIETKRLWGFDRYETCSEVVKEGWTTSDYAVVVNGENFPDALSASTLAKKYDAPILLTQANTLDTNTLNQLKRLNVKNVYIVGGSFVVNKSVEKAIKNLGIQTIRYSGEDRNETSVKVAEQIEIDNGIIIAIDDNYTDALSAAPMAGKLNMPIVLVPKDKVPASVKNFISGKSISKTYVLGGTDVISDAVASEFPNVQRITGADKYERNINIINTFEDKLDLSSAYLAYSEKFADALSGSALAALRGNPVILMGDTEATATTDFLKSKHFSKLNVLGGVAGIKDSTLTDLTNLYANSDTNSGNGSTTDSNKVVFKDTNLEKKVREAANKQQGDLSEDDVKNITTIKFNIDHRNDDSIRIKDLTGIENLTSLQDLELEAHGISDISALKGLTKLKIIKLRGNKISYISALKGLTNLNELSIYDNPISDISPLKGLNNLNTFSIDGDNLSDISALKGLTNLKELFLNHSKVSDISSLSNLTNLEKLWLNNNQISNISALKRLTNLKDLNLYGNQITDISELKGLTKLEWLELEENQITDISGLKGLIKLRSLGLDKNQISDISSLKELVNLEFFNSRNTNISDISSLKGLTNLKQLYLSDNKIKDISALTGLTNLTKLELQGNLISNNDIIKLEEALPNCEVKGL